MDIESSSSFSNEAEHEGGASKLLASLQEVGDSLADVRGFTFVRRAIRADFLLDRRAVPGAIQTQAAWAIFPDVEQIIVNRYRKLCNVNDMFRMESRGILASA